MGIDYAAPVGTPVWAAAPGTIIERGPAGGAGNLVIVRHDGGIDTAYMHLHASSPRARRSAITSPPRR